jgi:glyoxylase-like metal-dependent hydrolase (beta-lactamase superfamily II)
MKLETLSLTGRPQSSGEPDAGKPPVRFGGRGDLNTVVPTPILHSVPTGHAPNHLSFFLPDDAGVASHAGKFWLASVTG